MGRCSPNETSGLSVLRLLLDLRGKLQFGTKSSFLRSTVRGNRDVIYTLNAFSAEGKTRKVSSPIYKSSIRHWFSLQIDVRNALHYRGDSGERGTSLREIVAGKMREVLRRWLTDSMAVHLRQIHLHIDDPNYNLRQKHTEQKRRDNHRQSSSDENSAGQDHESFAVRKLQFQDEMTVPWSSLLQDRSYKDELA